MTTLSQRQRELGEYLIEGYPHLGLPGWPVRSAAAACGNATQENLCDPVTYGPKDHGSDGIMQWRLGRLTNMQAWCNKNFGRWDTLEAQAAFLMYEMKTQYPTLYEELHTGTASLATLTEAICWLYERPAKEYANVGYVPGTAKGAPGRINYAYAAQNLLDPPVVASAPAATTAVSVTAVAVAAAAGTAHVQSAPPWVIPAIIVVGVVVAAFVISRFVIHKTVAAQPEAPIPNSLLTPAVTAATPAAPEVKS